MITSFYLQIYHNGRHAQKAKPVQGVSHKQKLQLTKYNKQVIAQPEVQNSYRYRNFSPVNC